MAIPIAVCGCSDRPREQSAVDVKATFGEVGLSPGQFTYPRAMANDGQKLWIIDKSARVQRIDPETGQSSALWTMPDWEKGRPCGVSVGPDGLLYIPDTHYFRVMVYKRVESLDTTPELVSTFGTLGTGPGQFTYCTDVGILPTADGKAIERLYVAEYGGNDRISVFDSHHQFLFAIGRNGSSETEVEFNRPQSVEVDVARKLLVVTDACNHRIGVFDLEGKLVRWFGHAGSEPDNFAYPYGVALLGDGTAMVTEYGNHRVHHVDYLTGSSLGIYGKGGRARGEFTNPWAVTVLNDLVYVLDSGNDRVEAFKAPARRRSLASVDSVGAQGVTR